MPETIRNLPQKSWSGAPSASVRLNLRCSQCGATAEYDVGTVFYEPEPAGEGDSAKTRYSFSHYFRCQQCNSAGPWEIEDTLKLLGLKARSKLAPESSGIQKGHFAIANGTFLQTPALAEEFFLRRIQAQPRNPALYRELGDVFQLADQGARAAECYAKALALDPHDIESRYNLFSRALVADDIPATVLQASVLVRDMLDGYLASEPQATATVAFYLVEDLRAAPDAFRRHFLGPEHKRSKRPEDVFIRTLLTADGDEENILHDAAQRLLDGVPQPSALAGDRVVSGKPASAPAAPPPALGRDLVPSLAQVVQAEGLNPAQLSLAFDVPEDRHLRVGDKHEVYVSDVQKAVVWMVPALAELFRGDKVPPPHMDYFPKEYVPHFTFIERQFVTLCDILGDRTDQEMEEVYAALRRRPDGRSLGVVHDVMWQILALLLGTHVVSAAEYEALVGALLTSVRRWGLRPISRNYITYLRRGFGRPAPEHFPPR